MNEYRENAGDEALDQQIMAALRVETSPEQVARLEGLWYRRSRAQRVRRRMAALCGLAAAIAVTAMVLPSFHGTGLWRGPLPVNQLHPAVPRVAVADSGEAEASSFDKAAPEIGTPQTVVRSATTYERFVFLARSPETARRRAVVTGVAGMIDRLGSEKAMDAGELQREYALDPSAMEEELLRRLRHAEIGEQRTILRLLAICGTPRSAPQLLQLAEKKDLRDEALTILERNVDTTALPDLARLSPDRQVRTAIYRRLLTAEDEMSIEIYLGLIHDATVAGEVLSVADELGEPVLVKLLERLDNEDENLRLAAALALGRANGPMVTSELIRRVTSAEPPAGQRETWIALVACRGWQAEKFLAYAARQPRLLGALYRTRTWWGTRIPLWHAVTVSG